MKTVIARLDLGQTRIAGYLVYDSKSKEFQEKTPKEIATLINKNELNGLKITDGKVELDSNFRVNNLMVKSGVGKFRKLYDDDTVINCIYAVVKVIRYDDNTVYEVINNRCARVKMNEERVKMLIEIGIVYGVKLIKNEISICKGVETDDRTTSDIKKENKNLKK